MDITTLTETELKALGYEQLILERQAQANIFAIQQELKKRAEQPKDTE